MQGSNQAIALLYVVSLCSNLRQCGTHFAAVIRTPVHGQSVDQLAEAGQHHHVDIMVVGNEVSGPVEERAQTIKQCNDLSEQHTWECIHRLREPMNS